MSNITDVLPGVAVTDLEAALPWYERLFGRPADERPMEGLAEWLFGGARLQLVESADRAGKSTVTLVVDDVKAYYEELGKRGLNPGALDETTSDKVLFGYIADPEGNQIALVELRPAPRRRASAIAS
jgi:predicted enzyme related to lactoylglutathione lyase